MNRPIKFRVWDKTGGKMREAREMVVGPTVSAWIDDGEYKKMLVDGENGEFMHFTGLLDKNGREIYEGDTLRLNRGEQYQSDYEVIWRDAGFSLISAKRDGDKYGVFTKNISMIQSDNPIIIGNRFENPELCK